LSLYHLGRLNEAIEWLEQSLAAYTALGEPQNEAMVNSELGLDYMSGGRFDQALAHYNCALDYWRKTDDLVRQANVLNNLGVLHYLRGDYGQAGPLLEEALDCARRSGYARQEAFVLASIGDLYADLDAPDAALDAYHQARETAQRIDERFLLLYLDLAEAALARSRGQLAQAHALLDSARRLARESGSAYEQGSCHLGAGWLALAEGDALEAVARLEEAAGHFDDGGQRVEGARAHLYLAVAYHSGGDEQAALAHLGHAFHLASDLESQHTLVVAGREARTLLEAAGCDPALGRQASQLLRRIDQFEGKVPILRRRLRRQASAVPFAPPRLCIQALGKVQVLVEGRQVTGADWQAQVARDLLFCLLAHPDGLTREAIGAIFWPDSPPTQLREQFKKTIYRLRRALDQEVVLFDEERYRFNRALDYEYDVETFLGKLAQAEAATDTDEHAAAYGEAVRLYEGPYLPEAEGTWVWPERERLWRVYVAAILKLVRHHLEVGEHQVALEYCHQALVEDPCLEEAHRLAMRAHWALGNRSAVARQFEHCRQALLKELNAPPSPQTGVLYERLMG
jgi:DNA-binding SARP family transcriptional activator